MFDRLIGFISRLGAKLGVVRELGKATEHRKISVTDEVYKRIEVNKSIYKGYYKKWHDIEYKDSLGNIKHRDMSRLNLGKIIAEEMASLIFNEKCEVSVSARDEKEEPTKEFVEQVLQDNFFIRDFQRYLEYMFALGGVAIKVYEHEGNIKLAYAVADSFIPLSTDSENVDEALFITQEVKDNKYYTLLEWNEWQDDTYVITNELYESSNKEMLGYKVPLSTIYEELEEITKIEGLTRPMFVYIKPNISNNIELQSPLGISIYDNARDIIYQLDYMYDYLLHEFKLGKRRIAVDYEMLRPSFDAEGKTRFIFDTDDTVYFPMNGADGNKGVQDLSVGLRVSEIIEAINTNLNLLAMSTGFSSGTFTFEAGNVKTATQVISENSKTFKSKKSHEILVEQGIRDLVKTILEVANLTGVYSGSSDVDVVIDFDDSIVEDRTSNYQYYSQAVKDGLMPRIEAMTRQFKLTEEEAIDWIERIREEERQSIQLDVEGALDLVGLPARDINNVEGGE